jgi:hypothetical protein
LTLGEEGDTSNLCQFAWYEWCGYREHTAAFPNQQEVLGRVLGPARVESNEMCQWVLKGNGKVAPRRSVRPLNPSEIHSEVGIKKRKVFDELIERRHGTTINPPTLMKGESDTKEPDDADGNADIEPAGELPDIEDILDSTGKVLIQQPMWDKMINAEIILQQGDKLQRGKVKRSPLMTMARPLGHTVTNQS